MRHERIVAAAMAALVLILGVVGGAGAQTEDQKARAKAEYRLGKAAFEIGQFQEALGHYQKAYRIYPAVGLLFNIGQCHRNLGNWDKAIFSFELYLKKKPDTDNRKAVQVLLQDLERRAEEERKREAAARNTVPDYKPDPNRDIVKPPDRPPPPPPPTPWYKNWYFWVPVAVVAAAGGAVGTYFAVKPREAPVPQTALGPWDISP